MLDVSIYKTKDGHIELDVNVTNNTVWLSLNQIAKLFDRDKSVISRHISNVFKNKELIKKAVVAEFATTAADGKTYKIACYNLDVVISLGYRVNSKEGIRFRQWATKVLKEHLIKGFTLREKRLASCGIDELQQAMSLLQKTLTQNNLVSDIGKETIELIMSHSKTWGLLLAYDEDTLKIDEKGKPPLSALKYETALQAIATLRCDLGTKNESTAFFGVEREESFQGIIGNIEQTFGGTSLYKTAEERAANLIYFIIKDHPFSDGNKRIGCLIFLIYLKHQNIAIKLNDNGLIALALLIAESDPKQKDLMIRLIVNLIID